MMLPLLYLLIRTLQGGRDALTLLLQPRTWTILWNSLALTLAVTTSATLVGTTLAWLTVQTDLPGRKAWNWLTCLPLVLPSYVGAFALVAAFGPHGALQQGLAPLGIERIPDLYGFPGAWLALTLFTYPYVQLSVRAGLRGLDPSWLDAARSLGHPPRRIFRLIVLPHLRVAIGAGALLVALYTLSDFGAVSMLRFDAFTRAIYLQYTGALDRTAAAVLALLLVLITLTLLFIELRLRGRAPLAAHRHGIMRPAYKIELGHWRYPACGFCALVTLLALGIPVGVIGYWLIRDDNGWATWITALPLIWNSMIAAALAAGTCLAAALSVVLYAAGYPLHTGRWIERSAYIGYALPGIVVALALVFFGARYLPQLYQTLTLLVLAYVILFLPLAAGGVRASLAQVSPRMEEAARALGSSPRRAFWRVKIPLLRPGCFTGLALVFLSTMKELPATLVLGPTGFTTLATRIWSATEEALFARAAAPALILILVSACSLWIILRQEGRSVGSPLSAEGGAP